MISCTAFRGKDKTRENCSLYPSHTFMLKVHTKSTAFKDKKHRSLLKKILYSFFDKKENDSYKQYNPWGSQQKEGTKNVKVHLKSTASWDKKNTYFQMKSFTTSLTKD